MKTLSNSLADGYARVYSPISPLSDRELEILQLMGEGRDSQTIARRLRLTLQTVEAHRSNIQMILNLNGPALMQHRAH